MKWEVVNIESNENSALRTDAGYSAVSVIGQRDIRLVSTENVSKHYPNRRPMSWNVVSRR